MPNLDPVHKVTILPRGRSLGHTLVLPLEDRYTQTRSEMLDQLVYALGGRAAEELVFHEPTTGASDDIEKASKLARAMVTEYGMSAKLGAIKYGTGDAEPFMGRDYGHQRDYSEDIAADIDSEVRDLVEAAHDEAWEILVQYRDVLDQMVLELAEKETLAKDDLERILAPVRKRPPHNTFGGFGKRTPSDRPPIEIPPSVRSNGSANGAGSATPPPPDASAPVGAPPIGSAPVGAPPLGAPPLGTPPAPSPDGPSAPGGPPVSGGSQSGQGFGPTQTYGSRHSFGDAPEQSAPSAPQPSYGDQPTAFLPPVSPPPPGTYPSYPERQPPDGSQGSA
jgi:cell division protease FtsH